MGFYGLGGESEMLEIAMEAGGLAWWLMELPSGAVFFSPHKIAMLGYAPEQGSKFTHYANFTDLLHPDDFQNTMQAMRDHVEGKAEIYEAVYCLKQTNGKYIKLYDRGHIVARKDDEIAVAGIVLDITNHLPVTRHEHTAS